MYETERLTQLDLQNTVLGNIGSAMYAVAGSKKPPQPTVFNTWGYIRQVREAKEQVPEDVAKTLVRLNKSGRIPTWVDELIDWDIWEKAAVELGHG